MSDFMQKYIFERIKGKPTKYDTFKKLIQNAYSECTKRWYNVNSDNTIEAFMLFTARNLRRLYGKIPVNFEAKKKT